MSRSASSTTQPPLHVRPSSHPSRPAAATPKPKTISPPKILLVDDDASIRSSLSRALRLEGWTVVTEPSGERALERLAVHLPDLLITDLRMKAVSGWDLLFHERLERPRLPIFVITALPPSSADGADHFAVEFFQKPLDLEALVAAIRRRLRRS